jgi:hypothetical protein
MDTVKGGAGNDNVQAADDAVDHIDCGKGRRDLVIRDEGMDNGQELREREPLSSPGSLLALNFREHHKGEVRRRPLPRTLVNKAKKKGRNR